MQPLLPLLKKSLQAFKQSPLEMIFATVALVGATFTALFAGIALLIYLWFLSQAIQYNPQNIMLQRMKLMLQFQGLHRLRSLTLIGFLLWFGVMFMVSSESDFIFGFSPFWFLMQPLLLVALIANRYDLPVRLSFHVAGYFILSAPAQALQIMCTALLGLSGIWCGRIFDDASFLSILFFVTLPIAMTTAIQLFEAANETLAHAIQKAYR